MNSHKRWIVLLIALTIVAAVSITGCMKSTTNETNTTTSMANKTVTASTTRMPLVQPTIKAATPTPTLATTMVTIQNFAFIPSTVTVARGTTVVWTNQQAGVPHTVTSDTSTFASGTLNTGASFRFQFTTPGTYHYHCSIHPSMLGTVVVT